MAVIEKLVDVVLFVHIRIYDSFNTDGQHDDTKSEASACGYQRLGSDGLALHYANLILQIDGIVARSSSMTLTARDSLYQSLPLTIKSTLRSKLQTFEVKEEISITEIKAEMEKTLQWLVPMATNTVKSHHGFGWVGERANAGLDRALSRSYVVTWHGDTPRAYVWRLQNFVLGEHILTPSAEIEAAVKVTVHFMKNIRSS